MLVPVAASGFAIALSTGLMLFSVRAQEYALLTVLWIKFVIIACGVLAAIVTHLLHGLWLDRTSDASLAHFGLMSLVAWISALVCGRLIAFAV